MDSTARIPVDIDTRAARAKLKQLYRDTARAKKRITGAAQRTSRMATRAFAFTGAAAVIGKFQNNTSNVDVIQESLTPYYAQAQQMLDDGLGYSAKARKSAREQTKAAFALYVGSTGQKAGMRSFYDTVNSMQQDVESGRNLLRNDARFVGADPVGATKAAIKGNLNLFLLNLEASSPMLLLKNGFAYIVEGITAD